MEVFMAGELLYLLDLATKAMREINKGSISEKNARSNPNIKVFTSKDARTDYKRKHNIK